MTPTLHRAIVVAFDDTTWTAVVFLDGGSTETELPVGEWLPAGLFTAGDHVAVLLFDPTNPHDGLVLGPYGAVSAYNYPPLSSLTAGHTLQATGAAAAAFTGPLGARVTHSATQAIANSTDTKLAFDTERYDTGAFHSPSTNNSRLTVPAGAGGLYLIGTNVRWATHATGFRDVAILLNDTTPIARERRAAISGAITVMSLSAVCELSAADFVEVVVHQTSGGSLDVAQSDNYSPEFWIHRLL